MGAREEYLRRLRGLRGSPLTPTPLPSGARGFCDTLCQGEGEEVSERQGLAEGIGHLALLIGGHLREQGKDDAVVLRLLAVL